MAESTGPRAVRTIRSELHWVYHPLLDGHTPPAQDPLVEKARRLRERGATIITNVVRSDGPGVVHILEWLE